MGKSEELAEKYGDSNIYNISVSKLFGKKIVDVRGSTESFGGGATFVIKEIVFSDRSVVPVSGGQGDGGYLVRYSDDIQKIIKEIFENS